MAPYLRTVYKCQAMASTVAGQRRILKRQGSVVDYIRKAVETGVYRTQEELDVLRRERATGTDDVRTIMSRFRQDIVRGSFVHDYPTEYFILEQHPPIPDPPRTPKKLQKQLQPPPNPIAKLTQRYMQRHPDSSSNTQQSRRRKGRGNNNINNNTTMDHDGPPTSSEEYYRRLLGVQAAAASSAGQPQHQQPHYGLRHKPAIVQKAYAAAITHYQIQRTEPGLSDVETMRRVDAILAEQATKEQTMSRTVTQDIVMQKSYAGRAASTTTLKHQPATKSANDELSSYPFLQSGSMASSSRDGTSDEESTVAASQEVSSGKTSTKDTIFSDQPRTVQGMMHWSERLHAVPYVEWTIGASTALDHWIARQVLGISEETWQSLLEGDDPNLVSIGRDIIACREALFPETRLSDEESSPLRMMQRDDAEEMMTVAHDSIFDDNNNDDDEIGSSRSEDNIFVEKETKSIEELLQRLGGLRGPSFLESTTTTTSKTTDSPFSPKDDWSFLAQAEDDASQADMGPTISGNNNNNREEEDLDSKVERLVLELQSWRRRNVELPYEEWKRQDQDRFVSWMKGYVQTVASTAERHHHRIDYDATRIALLSGQPPVSAAESDAFWSQIQDQGTATALLDAMVEDGPPPGATFLQSAFWDLPRKEQLRRLLNLGALRPLLDEYTKESDRLRFLQRHGDTILTGVPLEHLVMDPKGPVQTSDLRPDVIQALRIPEGARFRLELIPYQTTTVGHGNNSTLETSRALYVAWNEHKAGRARYEEKLFLTGRLGLRYRDPIADPDQKKK